MLSPRIALNGFFASMTLIAALAGCATGGSSGAVDRESIRKVVGLHSKEIRNCYYQTIERRPGAEGKLVMSWAILPDGTTSEAKSVDADPRLEGIDACMATEIGRWVFPKPASGETVDVEKYPFYFSETGRIEGE